MRRILKLPQFIAIEYKKHQDSIVDKSSFRLANLFLFQPYSKRIHEIEIQAYGDLLRHAEIGVMQEQRRDSTILRMKRGGLIIAVPVLTDLMTIEALAPNNTVEWDLRKLLVELGRLTGMIKMATRALMSLPEIANSTHHPSLQWPQHGAKLQRMQLRVQVEIDPAVDGIVQEATQNSPLTVENADALIRRLVSVFILNSFFRNKLIWLLYLLDGDSPRARSENASGTTQSSSTPVATTASPAEENVWKRKLVDASAALNEKKS